MFFIWVNLVEILASSLSRVLVSVRWLELSQLNIDRVMTTYKTELTFSTLTFRLAAETNFYRKRLELTWPAGSLQTPCRAAWLVVEAVVHFNELIISFCGYFPVNRWMPAVNSFSHPSFWPQTVQHPTHFRLWNPDKEVTSLLSSEGYRPLSLWLMSTVSYDSDVMCIVLWFYIVNTKPRNRFQFVEELKPTDTSFYWILTEGKHICLA